MALAAPAVDATTTASFALRRKAMIDSQLKVTKVQDAAVIRAMGRVPREQFVPEARLALAYSDEAVPLGSGRYLMQPLILARLLSEAAPRYGDNALVIGAGTGYSAAVLADIGLAVTALESAPELAQQAKANLAAAGYPHVPVETAPLAEGYAQAAPYHLIVLDGAVEHLPDALIAQLADDGVMVGVLLENHVGRGFIGRKSKDAFGMHPFMDALTPELPGFAKPKAFTF